MVRPSDIMCRMDACTRLAFLSRPLFLAVYRVRARLTDVHIWPTVSYGMSIQIGIFSRQSELCRDGARQTFIEYER
jgi:hypothetical protein